MLNVAIINILTHTQVQCRHVVDDDPHVLGMFGVGPTSLQLWYTCISEVEHCDRLCKDGWQSTEGCIPIAPN